MYVCLFMYVWNSNLLLLTLSHCLHLSHCLMSQIAALQRCCISPLLLRSHTSQCTEDWRLFYRTVCKPNFFLYLKSLEDVYILLRLQLTGLCSKCHGVFGVSLYVSIEVYIPFTSIGGDNAQEQTNRDLKGDGGLQGITNKPTTLLKYCLNDPVLSRISKEAEDMFGFSTSFKTSTDSHHHDSAARLNKTGKRIDGNEKFT